MASARSFSCTSTVIRSSTSGVAFTPRPLPPHWGLLLLGSRVAAVRCISSCADGWTNTSGSMGVKRRADVLQGNRRLSLLLGRHHSPRFLITQSVLDVHIFPQRRLSRGRKSIRWEGIQGSSPDLPVTSLFKGMSSPRWFNPVGKWCVRILGVVEQ